MKAQALAERICQIKFHSGRKGVNLIAGWWVEFLLDIIGVDGRADFLGTVDKLYMKHSYGKSISCVLKYFWWA